MTSLDSLVQAYAFTDDDKARLTRLLAQAYLLSKAQAYQKAVATTRHIVQLQSPWMPGEDDAKAAQAWAKSQVESIAHTYEKFLSSELERQLSTERAFIDMAGKVKQAIATVKNWFEGFLPWKTKQIADYTWNKGANDGTRAFVDDLISERDDGLFDEDVTANLDRIRGRVTPDSSSSDFCADYAGNDYSLDELDSVPEFPAHTGCVHSIEVYVV